MWPQASQQKYPQITEAEWPQKKKKKKIYTFKYIGINSTE